MRSTLVARLSVAAAVLVAAGGLAVVWAPSASAGCSDIDIVSARGTGEPGTLGWIVGDPVSAALKKKISGKAFSTYRVNYPADLSLTSAGQGNTDLVNHVKSQAASCPNQRFVLVGYSQGANVVDNSMGVSTAGALVGSPITATIPHDVEPKVAAVLLFGNPLKAQGKSVTGIYQGRTLDVCAPKDPVCQDGGNDVVAHLSYIKDADDAAAFAAGKVG
jgi:cutinase